MLAEFGFRSICVHGYYVLRYRLELRRILSIYYMYTSMDVILFSHPSHSKVLKDINVNSLLVVSFQTSKPTDDTESNQ